MSGCQLFTDLNIEDRQSIAPEPRKRPLKVLTITPFYPSTQDPTQGRFIAEPLVYMQDAGISNTTIAVQPFYRRAVASADNIAASWIRYFSIVSNIGLPTAGSFLARRVHHSIVEDHIREPYDLMHVHSALPCGHAAMLLSEYLSIPFVVTVHGLDAFFTRQAGSFIGHWCRRVSEQVYRSAAAVVCISKKVREQVLNGVHANVAVIHNGVDTETFRPGSTGNSSLMVLSVGNLIPTKGHAVLLRAFAQALDAAPDCTLEIIGDGPERKNLVQLTSTLGIADKVHFRGRQNKSDVADAMRRCSVFALPSVYEGLGCVYLEAMACGKPVIGCFGQGIDEIIRHGETGMLVPSGNDAELRESLSILLRDYELRGRIGEAAHEIVSEHFTLRHQAQQLAEIYQRCVA